MLISRKTLLSKYQGRCAYCGRPLPKHGWHRDHVEPIGRHRGKRYTFGGRNGCKHPENHRADNIVAACRSCNLDKAGFDLETWRASLMWPPLGKPVVFWFEKCEAKNG